MDRVDLGLKLKQFYLLETYQVLLFDRQLSELEHEHYRKALETMIERERHHAQLIAEQLAANGFERPEPADDAYALAGAVSARVINSFPVAERFRICKALESEAVRMYKAFITLAWDQEALTEILWRNLIDEEFHQYWFAASADEAGILARMREPAHV